MNKRIFGGATAILAGTLTLLAAPSALALPMSALGGVDTIAHYGNPSPSEGSQTKFLADFLKVSEAEVEYVKLGGSGGEGGAWKQADDNPNVWYLDFSKYLDYNPLAFLIKTGSNVALAGTTTQYNTYVYTNTNQYAVVDLGAFVRTNGKTPRLPDIGVISHVSVGGAVSVPEPGTLALLGAGLVAAALTRRRKVLAQ